jgi:protoporphyrinogen oxidase
MRDPGRVLIVGAGPTGLGAAARLEQAGHHDWLLVEAREGPGGLASSVVDAAGFTWDLGGHVQFSHYGRYDEALDRALGDAWLWHERESWIWTRGRFVPYPFQNNLHRLPAADCARALAGLERAAASRSLARPVRHFGEWIDATFGEGIAEIFLRPYNEKVWGYPLETLGTGWLGDRVAVPDVERVRANVAAGRDDAGWGPNRRFRFPLSGGTGAIWRAVAGALPAGRLRYRTRLAALDLAARRARLAGGGTERFDHAISAVPLDRLAALASGLSIEASRAAASLRKSAVHVVGVGLRGGRPEPLARKCWVYFPDEASPHYRVTVFSNYSPHHVPEPGCWSLMAEVCESPHRPVDAPRIAGAVVEALRADGWIPPGAALASLWHRREEHGYPTPTVDRDAALAVLRPELEAARVLSRGRFGAWRYEVSNQDHSYMQGVEAAERLLGIGDEPTLDRPDWVNVGALLATAAAPG